MPCDELLIFPFWCLVMSSSPSLSAQGGAARLVAEGQFNQTGSGLDTRRLPGGPLSTEERGGDKVKREKCLPPDLNFP